MVPTDPSTFDKSQTTIRQVNGIRAFRTIRALMLLGYSDFGVLCSGCRRHKILRPRARPKGVPVFMFRFELLRRLATPIVLLGLPIFGLTVAPGAIAQQDKSGSSAAADPSQASPAKVDQTEDQTG